MDRTSLSSIELPTVSISGSFHDMLQLFQLLLNDFILYLSYGIAILCALKFLTFIINGITSNTTMGSRTMDDSSFFRGTNGIRL
jgi:membrane protein insertase Oxa1/YidC/SpoIIIJ